jgi:hypothetical protein
VGVQYHLIYRLGHASLVSALLYEKRWQVSSPGNSICSRRNGVKSTDSCENMNSCREYEVNLHLLNWIVVAVPFCWANFHMYSCDLRKLMLSWCCSLKCYPLICFS